MDIMKEFDCGVLNVDDLRAGRREGRSQERKEHVVSVLKHLQPQ